MGDWAAGVLLVMLVIWISLRHVCIQLAHGGGSWWALGNTPDSLTYGRFPN